MTTIVAKELPHKVGTAEIANAELKNIAMQFMENFIALGGQVADLQHAAIELQKAAASGSSSSGGGGGGGGGSVPSEITAAVAAAQTAANAAIANAASATESKNAAAAASAEAINDIEAAAEAVADRMEEAAERAEAAAASAAWSTSFALANCPLSYASSSSNRRRQFPMERFVPDTNKSYNVEITFVNTSTNTSVGVAVTGTGNQEKSGTVGKDSSTYIKTYELTNIPGDGDFWIDNNNSTLLTTIVKISLVQPVESGGTAT